MSIFVGFINLEYIEKPNLLSLRFCSSLGGGGAAVAIAAAPTAGGAAPAAAAAPVEEKKVFYLPLLS